MSRILECYFDVGSPASYLAWTQLPDLASRHDAELILKPMLLGGVFQVTGNQSPAAIESKGRYSRMDLQRFARRYRVTLNHNPHFPVNTLQLMRGAVAWQDTPRFHDYLNAVFTALWVDEKKMDDPDVVAQVLTRAGFNPQEFIDRAGDPEVKARLKANTTEAIERGVFGAPTLYVDNEMFFGQDRLWMVEEALG